ncbi:MAG: hypothetical protein DIKNOCCD_02361 [bacterium]|nr:hypothetical protein [bacterium]
MLDVFGKVAEKPGTIIHLSPGFGERLSLFERDDPCKFFTVFSQPFVNVFQPISSLFERMLNPGGFVGGFDSPRCITRTGFGYFSQEFSGCRVYHLQQAAGSAIHPAAINIVLMMRQQGRFNH